MSRKITRKKCKFAIRLQNWTNPKILPAGLNQVVSELGAINEARGVGDLEMVVGVRGRKRLEGWPGQKDGLIARGDEVEYS